MSTKRNELEQLAAECETCALVDDGPIDDHLLSCPVCSEQVKMAEDIDHSVHRMRKLSVQPEDTRREVLVHRLEDFMAMPRGERVDAMADMFEDLAELNEAQRTVIIKSRTDILTSLPKEQRDELFETARRIYSDYDLDRRIMEEQAILAATEDYNALKRTMVRRMYRKLMR